MEDIKDFLQRHPAVTEIHFDADNKWCYNPGSNFKSEKVMSREEILGKEGKASKKKDDAPKAETKKEKALRLENADKKKVEAGETFETENYEAAKKMYEEALALNPDDQEVKDRIAECENLLA